MAIVETKQIRKVFADHTAVDGVDLMTREGEFLVLLGPSGCGKTTLLRMIAGLEQQTSGDIVIGGMVVNDLPPRERKIAMVFQSYALYPHLTVAKNIAFPLKAADTPKEQIEGRVQKAASMFGIERLLHRKPRSRRKHPAGDHVLDAVDHYLGLRSACGNRRPVCLTRGHCHLMILSR